MQQLPKTTLPGSERGATLIVALVMLILISLLGVSSLKNASVAEKMSAADHQRNITFQASESAAALAIDNDELKGLAIRNGAPTTATADNIGAIGATAQIVMTPVGASPCLECSIQEGGGGFSQQRFMVTSTATLTADNRSTGETVHGVTQLMPR